MPPKRSQKRRVILSLICALHASCAYSVAQDCGVWVRHDVAPDPISFNLLAFDEVRQALIAFSPNDFQHLLGWTWRWNGKTWDVLSTNGPPRRGGAALAFDSIRGVIVLFGGAVAGGYSNDTWEWDG